jgi:hypothetical protein
MRAPSESVNVRLFLSSVSAEFRSYRKRLRHLLTRHDVEVKVQEDFIITGNETLEKLDSYIQVCDAVIHLVGDMSGAMASASSAAAIVERYPELVTRLRLGECLEADGLSLPYTQWEAWLALLHRKPLLIASASPEAPRDIDYRLDPAQQALQQAHLNRLKSVDRHSEVTFSGPDNLAVEVLRSFVQDLVTNKNSETSLETAIRLCRDANTLIGIDNAKASEYFNQVIRAYDKLIMARIGLATLEITLGNFETALIHFEYARDCILQHFPEDINSQAHVDVEKNISFLKKKINHKKRWLPF